MICHRCQADATYAGAICIFCRVLLCVRCQRLRHEEHRATWPGVGIYERSAPLEQDQAAAVTEAEMILVNAGGWRWLRPRE